MPLIASKIREFYQGVFLPDDTREKICALLSNEKTT